MKLFVGTIFSLQSEALLSLLPKMEADALRFGLPSDYLPVSGKQEDVANFYPDLDVLYLFALVCFPISLLAKFVG